MADDLDAKLDELFGGEDAYLFKPKEKKQVISSDDRLAEQFEGIVKFYKENGRLPLITSGVISEKLLAQRLNNYLTDKDKFEKLQKYDEFGILKQEKIPSSVDELFEKGDALFGGTDIFDVEKLPNGGRVRASGDVASRKPCTDFEKYRYLFEEKQRGLSEDRYKLIKFLHQEEVVAGGFYVYDGIMCYVDEIGEQKNVFGRQKERIHVVYENGTESNVYLRTLSSELYRGYIVVDKDYERTESGNSSEKVNGYVYVLRSLSQDPAIETIKDLYKIGKTDKTTEERIRNAENEPTYLMAPVEIVERIKCTGKIVPERLESLLHDFFRPAQMDITITDNNGNDCKPDEWYSVPIELIDEAVDLIRFGEITKYVYRDGEIVEIDEK